MLRSSLRLIVVLAALAMSGGIARGTEPYLNQYIMPKFEHLSASAESRLVGTETDFNWPLKVNRVNGQWLWIADDGSFSPAGRPIRAWVSKNEVILLKSDPIEKKSAIDYFTECLERNPYDGWAFWARGKVLRNNEDWRTARLDLERATKYAPWLDDAWESLAFCENQEAFEENSGVFKCVRDHIEKTLPMDKIPPLIRKAIEHFKIAASIRCRPNTFYDWGDALAIRTWSQFHRQIWMYYLEDAEMYSQECPECSKEYIAQRQHLNPFTEEGSWSAPCLLQRAIELFPGFPDAIRDRAILYEYAAEYRIYQMAQSRKWRRLSHEVSIDNLKQAIHKEEDAVNTLTSGLKSKLDEMDGLTNMKDMPFGQWQIKRLSEKCEEVQDKIDTSKSIIDTRNDDLKKRYADAEEDREQLDQLQRKTLRRIKHLIKWGINDNSATVAANETPITASRDIAALYLMQIDPTGRHPIRISTGSLEVDPALAERALTWARSAAELNDYEDSAKVVTLPTWAAALYETGSYDDAIRRERADWGLMDEEQKAIARDFIDRCNFKKKTAPVKP